MLGCSIPALLDTPLPPFLSFLAFFLVYGTWAEGDGRLAPFRYLFALESWGSMRVYEVLGARGVSL